MLERRFPSSMQPSRPKANHALSGKIMMMMTSFGGINYFCYLPVIHDKQHVHDAIVVASLLYKCIFFS